VTASATVPALLAQTGTPEARIRGPTTATRKNGMVPVSIHQV
jgi:hypothetical protein